MKEMLAYFDAPTGLSGNMILGSLMDAGVSIKFLKKELNKLGLKGYKFIDKKVTKKGVAARYFDVIVKADNSNRTIRDIFRIIDNSRLSTDIKKDSKSIFTFLFNAERKVHGGHIHHLHETGAIDAIIDIVGSCIAFKKLGIKEVYCSPLPYGHGKIVCEHGILPNPAPATVELLKGIPIYKKDFKAELVTPTGAAIMKHFVKSFTAFPKVLLQKTGMGAGYFDLKEPNILRVFIGEPSTAYDRDTVLMIETNIDNMNPELYDHVISRIMGSGAYDVSIGPIRMKKGRPGTLLTAIATIGKKDRVIDSIFDETSTLGVRTYLVKREKLQRSVRKVKTKYGILRVKIGSTAGMVKNVAPEYEDCVKAADKHGVPIKNVYDEAKNSAMKFFNPERLSSRHLSRHPYR